VTGRLTGRSPARWAAVDGLAVPVLAFLSIKLAVLIANLWWFPTLRRPPGPRPDAGRSVLLVPLRDEADRIPEALPGMLAAGFGEVVLLDDGSTDGTAELVEQLLRSAWSGSPARLIPGRPRPAGWAGKPWACAQLAQASDAATLVFCDADVQLAPGAAEAILAEMEHQGAQVFSVFPRHRTGSWSERLLAPLIVDVLLCGLPFGLLRSPVRSAAAAHGALLAFRREAYTAVGGFGGVRDEVVEDVALARLARRRGLRLGLALGGSTAQVRMYRNRREVTAGLGRGLLPMAGGRRWLVVLAWVWHVLAYTAPVLLAVARPRWRVAAALGVTERALLELKTGGRDWLAALTIAAAPVAAGPVVGQGLRRRQVWRGRSYVT
jgi:glycosyltransferase involved in cell wall biosynthesis